MNLPETIYSSILIASLCAAPVYIIWDSMKYEEDVSREREIRKKYMRVEKDLDEREPAAPY